MPATPSVEKSNCPRSFHRHQSGTKLVFLKTVQVDQDDPRGQSTEVFVDRSEEKVAKIEVFVEDAGGVQRRGDPRYLGDDLSFQGCKGRSVEPSFQLRQRLVQRRRSRKARRPSRSWKARPAGRCALPRRRRREPRCPALAPARGEPIPAAAGECLPAGWKSAASRAGQGSRKCRFKINCERPVRRGPGQPSPSTALAWRDIDPASRST